MSTRTRAAVLVLTIAGATTSSACDQASGDITATPLEVCLLAAGFEQPATGQLADGQPDAVAARRCLDAHTQLPDVELWTVGLGPRTPEELQEADTVFLDALAGCLQGRRYNVAVEHIAENYRLVFIDEHGESIGVDDPTVDACSAEAEAAERVLLTEVSVPQQRSSPGPGRER